MPNLREYKPKVSNFSQYSITTTKKSSFDVVKLNPVLFAITQNSTLAKKFKDYKSLIYFVVAKNIMELKTLLVPFRHQKKNCLILDICSADSLPTKEDLDQFLSFHEELDIHLVGLGPEEKFSEFYGDDIIFDEYLTKVDLSEIQRVAATYCNNQDLFEA